VDTHAIIYAAIDIAVRPLPPEPLIADAIFAIAAFAEDTLSLFTSCRSRHCFRRLLPPIAEGLLAAAAEIIFITPLRHDC